MSWTLLIGVVVVLLLSLCAVVARRRELRRMSETVAERGRIESHGGSEARLMNPVIDLSRCMGCGTCVTACPEDGVLEMVHGQAAVVNPALCEGIAACARECPVGAIVVTLGDLRERKDVPVLTESLEAVDSPGLFLAGEITAHALIKSAIEQGAAVGREVADRSVRETSEASAVLDLCVVGAGPAGLSCSLEAQRRGLHFVTLDREERIGGTVAKYPRRKLVLTQPVDLPGEDSLNRNSYTKEELIDLWQGVVERQDLPIKSGEIFEQLERDEDGNYVVRTKSGAFVARNVCLAMGRRGDPVKLGVEGEHLTKVTYGLMDASAYQRRQILVVGGGDSAVEAAMALAEQDGNEVTLSYRKPGFFRVRARNLERLGRSVEASSLKVLFESELQLIDSHQVRLTVRENGVERQVELPNDDVFVLAGGSAPFEMLERAGISFDQTNGKAPEVINEQGLGVVRALQIGLALSALALLWAVLNFDYYGLDASQRPGHAKHLYLRSGRGLGLGMGIASVALIALNLFYLVRRSPRFKFERGSLSRWMTSHVATGILAVLFALLHGVMDPRNSAGGHAFWGLAFLLVTGGIGRYFYAWVPRATNGRELKLSEVKAKLAGPMSVLDEDSIELREFKKDAGREVFQLVESRQWRSSLVGRIATVVGIQGDLRRSLRAISERGKASGIKATEIDNTVALARTAFRRALMLAHFEDLRAILSTWRYFHRWMAVLMVVLVIVHVAYAMLYGELFAASGVR
ncbi:MAG: thioredoxin reductase/Pyruvate/2-oxoacid:ferredoxin oxidoreductase delta subunit [Planctomycetota bacterium]|jgi:thioredoxin reductase/Pyruvate/2-oxoacid:ferredoxin oxidoreductase delta subunit